MKTPIPTLLVPFSWPQKQANTKPPSPLAKSLLLTLLIVLSYHFLNAYAMHTRAPCHARPTNLHSTLEDNETTAVISVVSLPFLYYYDPF